MNIIRSQTRLCGEILEKVEEGVSNGVPADQLLSKIVRSRREIGSRDRRLINDLVFSSFRWKGWLKRFVGYSQQELYALALLMDGKNKYEICRDWGESLEIVKNGMDSLDFDQGLNEKLKIFFERPNNDENFEIIKELFPSWLMDRILFPKEIGSKEKFFMDFAATLQMRPPSWFRTSLKNGARFSSILEKANVNIIGHPVLKSAWAVTTPVNLNIIKEIKSFPYETQDLSSQAVGLVCAPKAKETWLDACAGSGGKTLHLAQLLKGKGEVIAYDIRRNMLKKIITRSKKWGLKNISIFETRKRILKNFPKGLDGVLVDAPCSGVGTWRRNPDARWRLTESELTNYSELQYELLVNMSFLVRAGGVLVYSVCTLTQQETRDCIQRFLNSFKSFKLQKFSNPITGEQTDGTLEIWPQNYNCDGMFVVKMQKSN